MGKQVNFFIAPEELPQVEQYLRGAGEFIALADCSKTSQPRRLSGLDDFEGATSQVFLVRPQDLSKVRMRAIPARHEWMVDIFEPPVIEFSRCVLSTIGLSRGRLYAQTSYFDAEDNFWRKDPDFITWLDKLLRRTKRLLEKEKDSFFYLSPGAKALHARGVTLMRI